MDQERKMSKKELKALKKLEKLDKYSSESSQNRVKWIIIGLGAVIFLGFFSFLVFILKQNNVSQEQAVIADDGWVKGNKDAKVALVEYGDFQCPACKMFHPIVRDVMVSYDGQLKLMYKHFPLTAAHPNALLGALAAEAAGAQGKFFEMHDILFERQEEWSPLPAAEAEKKLLLYSDELGLDSRKFADDLNNPDLQAKIKKHQDEGINNGVNSTPSFFLNNRRIVNPQSAEEFKKLIDEELKKSNE